MNVVEEGQNLNGPGMFWPLIILTMVLMALAVLFFGKDNYELVAVTETPIPSEERVFRTYTVYYRSGVFSPTNLRIHLGDTVRFKNESTGIIRVITDPHPEHNAISGFDSVGDIPQNSFFAFTFANKGIFGYHNEKNPNETGTIIVR